MALIRFRAKLSSNFTELASGIIRIRMYFFGWRVVQPADLARHSMQRGTIKRLIADRGFGFIKTEREEELFFGRNQLQGVDYGSLREGQKVEFEVTRDPNGRLHAIRVRLAQPKGE